MFMNEKLLKTHDDGLSTQFWITFISLYLIIGLGIIFFLLFSFKISTIIISCSLIFLIWVGFFIWAVTQKGKLEKAIETNHALKATGEILEMDQIRNKPVIFEIRMKISAGNIEPYTVLHTQSVDLLDLKQLENGKKLNLLIHPNNPALLKISFLKE
jgi:hypothetical protein